jgi:UDPglucose 6-dehydrogenase
MRLNFTTDTATAVQDSEIVFIAVGTPPSEDGSADLQYVLAVATAIGKAANGPKIIVDKSTVPVGTADKVKAAAQAETQHEMSVVSNPEFLKEGAAIDDFMKPDRVVVGSSTEAARDIMHRLYEPFVHDNPNKIIHMDVRSAELTKYAANAMLATRISFMNEIANICSLVGANVDLVRKGIGSDGRIGSRFLFAGLGYGGSCFPKDVKAIVKTAEDSNYDFRVLRAVEEVNERQKRLLYDQVKAHFEGDVAGKKFAVWGLAFKPNTDDMREAPSIVVIENLLKDGATVTAFDPEAMQECKEHHLGERITYAQKAMEAVEGADALILITEWNKFRRPDFEKLKASMKTPLIFDGRNIYSRAVLERLGYTYYAIGT